MDNIKNLEIKIKSLESKLQFKEKYCTCKSSTISTNSSSLCTNSPIINVTKSSIPKTKRLHLPSILHRPSSPSFSSEPITLGRKPKNFHYNSRLGYKKFPYQCDICDWSTPNNYGLNVHKAKEHGCKYRDEYGMKCPNIQCRRHRLLFDPTNSKGEKLKKEHECDMCDESFESLKGLATHKGLVHKCKYRDEFDRKCQNYNCKIHHQDYEYEIIID